MLKYWSATSLLALALLGCFVEQGVKAQQDSVLQPRLSIHYSPNQKPNAPTSGIGIPGLGSGSGSGSWGSSAPTGQGSQWGSAPTIPSGTGTQKPHNPLVNQGHTNSFNPPGNVGSQKPSNPFGQSQQHGTRVPSASQSSSRPNTGSLPGIGFHVPGSGSGSGSGSWGSSAPTGQGSQWGSAPTIPSGTGTQKQQNTPLVQHGNNNPINRYNRFGQSQGQSNPTVSQGHSQQHGSAHGSHVGKPGYNPGSHRPTISSNPTGWPPKSAWSPKPGNPSQSRNPSTLGTQKFSIMPRASQITQKQRPATNDPSQKLTHLTGVAKDSDEVICDKPTELNPQCGGQNISPGACHAMGCCYEGSRCYYAKTVTVQCTKTGEFIVVVAKDVTQPRIDVETISLKGSGPSCHYVDSNSEFAIYHFNASDCGTTVSEEEYGLIVYENAMESYFEVQSGNLGQITRDSNYMVVFQCRYTATSMEALVIQLTASDPPLPVSSSGPVTVQMRLGSGQCSTKGCDEVEAAYTDFYTDYPVQKVLQQPVYVEVEVLDLTDPFVVLTLDHCWTTTTSTPHGLPQWDILINGCPNPADPYQSELVPVHPEDQYKRRFFFKMFAFTDNSEGTYQQVYIHCTTSLCLLMPGAICEPLCYRKFKKREAPIAEKRTTPNAVVTNGPVTFFRSTKI